jgi:hypothetical protein
MIKRKSKSIKRSLSVQTKDRRLCKDREVRDLYNALNKKYKYHVVLKWFAENYFLDEFTLMGIIRRCDTVPVDLNKASINYKVAIKPDYHI